MEKRAELEKRMEGLGKWVREVGINIESLNPQIGHLHERLNQLQGLLSNQLGRTTEVCSLGEITHLGKLTGRPGLGKHAASRSRGCHQFAANIFRSTVVCSRGQLGSGVFSRQGHDDRGKPGICAVSPENGDLLVVSFGGTYCESPDLYASRGAAQSDCRTPRNNPAELSRSSRLINGLLWRYVKATLCLKSMLIP